MPAKTPSLSFRLLRGSIILLLVFSSITLLLGQFITVVPHSEEVRNSEGAVIGTLVLPKDTSTDFTLACVVMLSGIQLWALSALRRENA
jgi:hypothetical protein